MLRVACIGSFSFQNRACGSMANGADWIPPSSPHFRGVHDLEYGAATEGVKLSFTSGSRNPPRFRASRRLPARLTLIMIFFLALRRVHHFYSLPADPS
jgi:hypothetical protein